MKLRSTNAEKLLLHQDKHQPQMPRIRSKILPWNQSMVLLYDRHSTKPANKSYTTLNWSFNNYCKSLKGILVLFVEEQSYVRDTSKFYNPKIKKGSVIIEGKNNQLFTQGMRSFKQYDEICEYFAKGKQRDINTNEVQKHLQLHG